MSGVRHALVQGASRGLGLALVEALLSRGQHVRVFATARDPQRSTGLARLAETHGSRLALLPLDVCAEATIAAAASAAREAVPSLHLVVNAAGVLHSPEGVRPEKRLADVDPTRLRSAFEVNAWGPLLVAKHFAPLLARDARAVFANVSARVGSIGDNRLGGWYGYRASKAAQNMFTRTLAIELARSVPGAIVVALHPGTVDTELSRPFQRGVPADRLQTPAQAAARLLDVVDSLGPEDSGSFLDAHRQPIPW
jgi:NAD(P)-dependent dehydrogenase (short-subunit alcohol dehydrogenase family)